MKPIIPWWVWVAVVAVVSGALYMKPTYAASYIAIAPDGDFVRLKDEPCQTATSWLKLKKAEMSYRGKQYAACWTVVGRDIVILDEAGDTSVVPMGAFKRDVPI